MKQKKPKPKRCRSCGNEYQPYSSLSKACSPVCAIKLVEKDKDKQRKAQEREFRKETRERREKLKTRSDHLREAQNVFNKYIRLRDKGKPCISCGRMPNFSNYIGGSGIHAGHFRSVGAAPELRYCEDNCHVQCYHCNVEKSGNAIDYRINLKDKIGDKRLEFLEGPHEPKKYTIDQIKELKAKYLQKIKDLQNNQ